MTAGLQAIAVQALNAVPGSRDTTGLRAFRGEMVVLRTDHIRLTRPVRLLHPRQPLYIVPRAGGMTALDCVIIDELGYIPFPKSGGSLLFHLIRKLYETTSIIVTTNLVVSANRVCSHFVLACQ